MPIVAGAILPHSPLLVPTVAQDHFRLLEKTVAATRTIVQELYAAQPDVVVILTPHGETPKHALSIQTAERYQGRFLEFGDPHTTVVGLGSLGAVHKLRQSAEHHHISLSLQTPSMLDYGASVPLYYLNEAWTTTTIIPLSIPAHKPELSIRSGAWLYDFWQGQSQRVAIIGSLDGSRQRSGSDIVRRPTPEERTWSSAITAVDPSILPTDHKSQSCAEPILRTFLTTLQPIASQADIRSFEAPFGVGLLTAWLRIAS